MLADLIIYLKILSCISERNTIQESIILNL